MSKKARIIRMFCSMRSRDMLTVQVFSPADPAKVLDDDGGYWRTVKDFELDEYPKACAFAMDLSMSKKEIEVVVSFEEGAESNFCGDKSSGVDSSGTSTPQRPS